MSDGNGDDSSRPAAAESCKADLPTSAQEALETARDLIAMYQYQSQRCSADAVKIVTVARALLSALGWRGMESAPMDQVTIEVCGVMRVHRFDGCKFPVMPKDWRPDTPQSEWRLTGWRHVQAPSYQAAHAVDAEPPSHEVASTPNLPNGDT